ncbi:hypothetical protein GYMLUDRAFT_65039 [Collybiopsis luxurians FD-317 M1]|uniref:Uncharacterized protein n=1 Tax=Collybiopsis luxurians FD-317 M1 TaxID=944289 RepID=A0A0D0C0F5_9AGAR|nr:hypothetical protein GYMLUDRAFT_65039 [Collybiopsis luxurians FD-317 M1]
MPLKGKQLILDFISIPTNDAFPLTSKHSVALESRSLPSQDNTPEMVPKDSNPQGPTTLTQIDSMESDVKGDQTGVEFMVQDPPTFELEPGNDNLTVLETNTQVFQTD